MVRNRWGNELIGDVVSGDAQLMQVMKERFDAVGLAVAGTSILPAVVRTSQSVSTASCCEISFPSLGMSCTKVHLSRCLLYPATATWLHVAIRLSTNINALERQEK